MSLIPEENLAKLSTQERAAVQAIEQYVVAANNRRPLLEPEEDEGSDGVEFTKTGWVRLFIGTERWRLRPPFFADLRALTLLLEEHQDTMIGRRADIRAKAAEIQARLDALNAADALPMTVAEKATAEVELTLEMNGFRRKVEQEVDDARMAWYVRVFELLNIERSGGEKSKGKVPKSWPAWVANTDLPSQLIEHWRNVPLGRGSGPAK